jgi:hypothetical protein
LIANRTCPLLPLLLQSQLSQSAGAPPVPVLQTQIPNGSNGRDGRDGSASVHGSWQLLHYLSRSTLFPGGCASSRFWLVAGSSAGPGAPCFTWQMAVRWQPHHLSIDPPAIHLNIQLSPISAPAAGPFPPQISPEGTPRVPPTQLGPAPAAEGELPRGRLKKLQHQDRTQTPAGQRNLYQAVRATRSRSQPKMVCEEH